MATPILMPALSPTMTEGAIAKWLKAEGDVVQSGDPLAEIETDKATMELEAVEEGILGKIIQPEGSEGIPVNEPIAVILAEGEDASAADGVTAEAAAPMPTPESAPVPVQAPGPPAAALAAAPLSGLGERIFASPLAKRLATEGGLDLASINGSGPHGRIVKWDVEQSLATGTVAPPATAQDIAPVPSLPALADAPPQVPAKPQIPALPQAPLAPQAFPGQEFTEIPHSNMRKVIAQRLQESKQQVPHFYLTIEVEIDKLLEMRRDLNGRAPDGKGAYKISVNDFVIRAVALSLKKVPMVNVSWTDTAMRQFKDIDVAVAVAIEGGLLTPILKNADQKGLAEISVEMKDLGARAKDGKLTLEEYQGGGFSISNLGMFGVSEFSAIINPPQSCILAVGAGEQRAVVKDGALSIATMMSCTLSVDHRAVDGALGAEFLQVFKAMLEDPLTMML